MNAEEEDRVYSELDFRETTDADLRLRKLLQTFLTHGYRVSGRVSAEPISAGTDKMQLEKDT